MGRQTLQLSDAVYQYLLDHSLRESDVQLHEVLDLNMGISKKHDLMI